MRRRSCVEGVVTHHQAKKSMEAKGQDHTNQYTVQAVEAQHQRDQHQQERVCQEEAKASQEEQERCHRQHQVNA